MALPANRGVADPQPWRQAVWHAWWLASALALLVPVVAVAAPSVLAGLPRCASQVQALRPCGLCGMTTATRQFSQGRPLRATLAHGGVGFAWIACACNGIAASLAGLHRVGRRRTAAD